MVKLEIIQLQEDHMEFSKKDIESVLLKPKREMNGLKVPMFVFPVSFAVIFVIVQNTADIDMRVAGPIIGIMGGIFTLAFISAYSTKYKIVKDFENVLQAYVNAAKSISIPDKPYEIDENSSFGVPYYVWFSPTKISLFPKMPTYENYKNLKEVRLGEFQISKIKYYYTSGDKYYENKISGGGSTGPNVAGAIIGEQIAGIGGAIVMGQSKTNPIESKLIVHDERRTVIAYREDQGMITKYLLPFDFYEVLYDLLPDLSRDIVENPLKKAQASSKQEQEISTDQIEAKLKKLLDLRNSGLIDDQDYQEQKSKLLNKM